MSALDELSAIASDWCGEPCRVHVAPSGRATIVFPGGGHGRSQNSARDLALVARRCIRGGIGALAQSERDSLEARLTAWLDRDLSGAA